MAIGAANCPGPAPWEPHVETYSTAGGACAAAVCTGGREQATLKNEKHTRADTKQFKRIIPSAYREDTSQRERIGARLRLGNFGYAAAGALACVISFANTPDDRLGQTVDALFFAGVDESKSKFGFALWAFANANWDLTA